MIGVYLLFAAVVMRTLVVFAGDRQLALVMGLLAGFGLLLFAGPWFIRHRTAVSSPTRSSWEQTILPLIYLLLQSGLVTALLFIPATEDFFGNLFILLSLDAVLYLGRRKGFLAIVGFSLVTAVALASSAQGPLFGIAMACLYGGVGFLFGGYAHRAQEAETARRQNERLMAELQAAHRRLQGYVTQTEEIATEQERGRLARELHDSVTQSVFSMNLTVQGAGLLLARDPDRVTEQLARLEALAASAMHEIQALVSQLRPNLDTVEGLPGALCRLAAERLARDGLRVSVEVNGERDLPAPVVIGLYAIVQEALSNVARHAATGTAVVRLSLADSRACLEIQDEGPGFDLEAALAESGHLGLIGMADRAREMGWHLLIDSGHGRGTRIRVEDRVREGVE
ncbi:MAG: sensor histidine kinase [Anaerolineae bacterium]|nr:sensor histidine kinase [Anaerolineae bacterium]